MAPTRTKVAIACQGGGSHTAFTAGVLAALFEDPRLEAYEIVGLSGTSGGAVCASLAWSGLLSDAASPLAEAVRRLTGFWDDLKAIEPLDAAANFWGQVITHLPVTAEVSPYVFDVGAASQLRDLLEKHLAFPPDREPLPRLLVAATDVLEGCGRIIDGRDLLVADVIASAAVPPIFKAVRDRGAYLWDGLFSHNPPVRALTDLDPKPDEIWVVRINPERRTRLPRTMPEIIDRRNELAGNLSMERELDFIDKVNDLIAGEEKAGGGRRYKPIKVKVVPLEGDYDYPSKLDRRPEFIDGLLEEGRRRASILFDDRSIRRAAAHDIRWRGGEA